MHELFLDYTGLSEEEINKSFLTACKDGNLQAVKYLLNSSELPVNANIAYDNHKAIYYACIYSRLELVKYLLTSPDLNIHSDIYANDFLAFKGLCINILNNNEQNMELFEYLVFDYKIKENQDLIFFLDSMDGSSLNNLILNRNLQDNLSCNKGSKRKIKV